MFDPTKPAWTMGGTPVRIVHVFPQGMEPNDGGKRIGIVAVRLTSDSLEFDTFGIDGRFQMGLGTCILDLTNTPPPGTDTGEHDRYFLIETAEVLPANPHGEHWPEGAQGIDRKTLVLDLADGQFRASCIKSVLCINPVAGTCRDVTREIAKDVMSAAINNGHVPRPVEEFCFQHLGFAHVNIAIKEAGARTEGDEA